MPTRIFECTVAPADITDAGTLDINGQPLALEDGKRYAGRYYAIPSTALMFVRSTPDGETVNAGDAATPIRVFEDLIVQPISGESVWVWSEKNGQLSLNEIP